LVVVIDGAELRVQVDAEITLPGVICSRGTDDEQSMGPPIDTKINGLGMLTTHSGISKIRSEYGAKRHEHSPFHHNVLHLVLVAGADNVSQGKDVILLTE
jgi:hypothetical protein